MKNSIVREGIALNQTFCYPKTLERKYSGKVLTMFLPFTILMFSVLDWN